MEVRKENGKIIAKMSEKEYEFIRIILLNLNESLEYDWDERIYSSGLGIAMSLESHILLNKILLGMKICTP